MKFLVEILCGPSFEIEVDNTDTLLEVKQKIEKSQRIPVSNQTLIVDGAYILREDLNVEQCQIVHNSRLELDVSADDNPTHNSDDQMPQTEPSPAPSISIEEYFEGQGWPLTAEEIRKIYSYKPETTQGISKVQDSPVPVGSSSKNQVLHQTEQSPPSNSTGQIITGHQDSPVTVGSSRKNQVLHQTDQSPPSNSAGQIITGHQDSTVTVGSSSKNQVLHQTDQSTPSSSAGQIITGHQDSTVTVGSSSKNQVLHQTDQSPPSNSAGQIITGHQDSTVTVNVPQTEQSPPVPSDSVKEFTNIQESPVDVGSNIEVPKKRITVIVVTYSGQSLFVRVNTTEVNILRRQLVQSRREGRISLPQEEYLFMNQQHVVMNEDESFSWNGVHSYHNGTIKIVPKHVTQGSVTHGS